MSPNNPRSSLHALTPLGCGTGQVESLQSYFCRLAASHAVSLPSLARLVASTLPGELRENFDWHERNLNGTSDVSQSWAAALSSLTGVGHLDKLTLLPWREVMAQRSLTAKSGRWCPECFAEDQKQGRSPYFRLVWELSDVKVCHRHQSPLVNICPDCGRRDPRHKATYVIPGWCSCCGGFLGCHAQGDACPPSVTPEAMWVSRQAEQLVAAQQQISVTPTMSSLAAAIQTIVTRLDAGKSAAFARRIGLSKATVHHWLRDGGTPTLGASLQIAAHAGLILPDLLSGKLDGWAPPMPDSQLVLDLRVELTGKRSAPRVLDWDVIKTELRSFMLLPVPISVAEAGRRLNIDDRHLYLRANQEARALGERWKRYLSMQKRQVLAEARPHLIAACSDIVMEGRSVSLREVEARVPAAVLGRIESLFDVLVDIKNELGIA
ncbi:TniQ family protein [Vogesella amnigena]|uniref:TniQ family protein n=1 Tax=Vogesella amnigena TaxID=1507449 RepID=A0ABV7TYH2_9NEIS